MKFIDEVTIHISSGKGGPGKVSFRRDALTPRGGPDGGDGGKGGDVIFEADTRLGSLLDLKLRKSYKAQDGRPGAPQDQTGAAGENLVLRVPPGTVVKSQQGEVLFDIGPEQLITALKGGRGGKGNTFFKSSVNQAPTRAQPGEPGQERMVHLELKLIADVGIVGLPNAGKSTLISRISKAKPKIADYPFTTLVPNLGVVPYHEGRNFVVADIPGLVEGAHSGVGLGTQFLRHIERTKIFVHLIDASSFALLTPWAAYQTIQNELTQHDQLNRGRAGFISLAARPQLVVLNKVDTQPVEEINKIQESFRKNRIPVLTISAASGLGIKELIDKIAEHLYGKDTE